MTLLWAPAESHCREAGFTKQRETTSPRSPRSGLSSLYVEAGWPLFGHWEWCLRGMDDSVRILDSFESCDSEHPSPLNAKEAKCPYARGHCSNSPSRDLSPRWSREAGANRRQGSQERWGFLRRVSPAIFHQDLPFTPKTCWAPLRSKDKRLWHFQWLTCSVLIRVRYLSSTD